MSVTSRTLSDIVRGVGNRDIKISESLPNNTRSSLQMLNSWHIPTTSFSDSTNFLGDSRTVSDFVCSVTNPSLIPSNSFPNNAGSYLQMHNLWHEPMTSFS